MSDIPKPWFMFGKENDEDNDEIDKLKKQIQAKIDSLTKPEDESTIDDEMDYSDDSIFDDDLNIGDENSDLDTQFKYINEKLCVFPESTQLLWSAIYLALKNRRPIVADEYFKKLIAIPIKKHDFNTIISEIQYMLSDPFGRETQIRKYARFLQKKYPAREEGLFYEGILEEKLGNWEKSIRLLKGTVEKCKRAPKSAEHLANILLDAGEYEAVIRYVKLADMMSASKKPVVNMSELDFNLYLAKDALLKQRDIEGKEIKIDEIDDLRRSFEKLKIDHSILRNDSTLQGHINKLNSLKNELEK